MPPACQFFAFIDDDEVPVPDWLERLMEAQRRNDADVVQGSVKPVFCEGAPRWLVKGDFLGWPRRSARGKKPDLIEYQDLQEAYTNNVLVRRSAVFNIGQRFDPAFALTGGGDTHFFRALHAAGSRIVYAPAAIVHEFVPPERATLWYRMRLEYRIAVSPLKARPDRLRTKSLPRRVKRFWRVCGAGKIVSGVGCLAGSALRLSADGAVVGCLRIAHGAGQFAGLFGLSYRIYR